MSRLLLTNCNIINHNNRVTGNILIDNGKIVDIIPNNDNNSINTIEDISQTIDCTNLYALPGLVDMHVHMRDPGFEYKEDIESVSRTAVAGGVTSALCMANTDPIIDNSVVASYVYNKGLAYGLLDIFPYGSVTKGMKGAELTEMGDILDAGAVGFSDDGHTIMNAEVMRRSLEYVRHFNSFIAVHAIDTDLQGDGVMNEGRVSAINGLKGIPPESESVIVARDILLAKLTRSRLHICHISSKDSIDLVRWGKSIGVNITAEVTPHHFTLTEDACLNYDTNCKMSPPLRMQEDLDAAIDGLADGTIDCIATDHAPHLADEKFIEFDNAPTGIIGLQTLIPLTIALINSGKLSWEDFARVGSYNPANIIGKTDRGEIARGKKADIVLIDPNSKYIFNDTINRSKSMNTPFWNKELIGRAVKTIKNGKVVFEL